MSATPLQALVHQRAAGTTDLEPLWHETRRREWLAPGAGPVVIQIDRRWRSPLVVETARSLAAYLGAQLLAARVVLMDPAAGSASAGEESAFTVAGTVAHSLRVPAAWFEGAFLITITGVGPDAVTRLSAVLDAQAAPLQALNPSTPAMTLAYETHRLFASDLVVACATAHRNDPSSEPCWFVGPSDLGVEMALARACGCDPSRLPYVALLARHEIVPALAPEHGATALQGYLAPAWQARMHAARTRVATTRHAIIQDVVAVRRNLRRIPPAIRRRLAARKRGAG